MKYIIVVNKNNGNSGEYETGIETIELDTMSEKEAVAELLALGRDVDGYTGGNIGSPTHAYELTLWAEIDQEGNEEPIKSVYTNENRF